MFLGSVAAGIHSSIGNVASGSLFALAQSAGTGAFLPLMALAAPVFIAGAVVAGIGAAMAVTNAQNANNQGVCPVCNRPRQPQ